VSADVEYHNPAGQASKFMSRAGVAAGSAVITLESREQLH
jgi:hypothetical protein